MKANESWGQANRLGGLRRFAIAITVLNVLGHTVFGFEQSWAQVLIALATGYSFELLHESIDAWSQRRKPRFSGGGVRLIDFLLSAHISSLAVAMLLYPNERLGVIVFATVAALASKAILRVRAGQGTRHFFNPSNFGITLTLLLFPWVGIAPPYHFSEALTGAGDWILPAVIICTGSLLNAKFTHRLPLISAWLCGFSAQALLRHMLFDASLEAALLPMTGVAFILYTFYMVTDPATTPSSPRAQIAFGAAVAFTYGLLLVVHVVFGLFFALTVVCAGRGLGLYVQAWAANRARASVRVQTPAVAREA
jgi:enediyne biosynthesis protein E5